MAYNTPELLLVGAAQNFVLGVPKSFGQGINHDVGSDGYTHFSIVPDSANW